VPAPSFWWLDHYPELFEDLAQGTTIWDDEYCLIFELEGAAGGAGDSPPAIARPLQRLLEALLPRGACVAVLTSGDSRLLAVEGCQTVHFPHRSGGRHSQEVDVAEALEQLAELRAEGVEYLVIPHVSPSWVDSHPDFVGQVEGRYCTIAHRQGVCTVYELKGHARRVGLASRLNVRRRG
jgi:hypothetical protein